MLSFYFLEMITAKAMHSTDFNHVKSWATIENFWSLISQSTMILQGNSKGKCFIEIP